MLIFLKGENINQNDQNEIGKLPPYLQEQLEVATLWPCSCYEGKECSDTKLKLKDFVAFISLIAIDTFVKLVCHLYILLSL